jgi:hypothetical protein
MGKRYTPPKGRQAHAPEVRTRIGSPISGDHEWVSFRDAKQSLTWVIDLTFLESNWTCIYGRGCKGVRRTATPDRQEGCCSYGAHFSGAADIRHVRAVARRLTSEHWQFMAEAEALGGPIDQEKGDVATTRLVEGACVFLNRPGFEGGVGCALHIGALANGERPLDWKPHTCWQLPFRVDQSTESGHRVLTLRQWEREDWGRSGNDFHWWCTEPEAFVGTRHVYEELRDELKEMIGPAMHARLEQHLARRSAAGMQPTVVPVALRPNPHT